jgi:hypothetical protein
VFRIKTFCSEAPLVIEDAAGDELLLERLELEVP